MGKRLRCKKSMMKPSEPSLPAAIQLRPERDTRRFIGWELQVNYFGVALCPPQDAGAEL